MRTIKIREVSATVIGTATEPFAITNDNVVCGVMIPVSPRWVQEVVHQNLSRIANSIQFGEKEVANGEPFVTLTDALAETLATPSEPSLRRVSIRQISGKLITEAAASGEPLAITSDNVLHGVLIPVSQRWLQEVVDSNLSRVVRSIRLGEREVASEHLVTLGETLERQPPKQDRGRGAVARMTSTERRGAVAKTTSTQRRSAAH